MLLESILWMLFGDLNEIIDNLEKLRGKDIYEKRLFLKEFIHQVRAMNLGFIGRKFTWFNSEETNTLIIERLDRVIASHY